MLISTLTPLLFVPNLTDHYATSPAIMSHQHQNHACGHGHSADLGQKNKNHFEYDTYYFLRSCFSILMLSVMLLLPFSTRLG